MISGTTLKKLLAILAIALAQFLVAWGAFYWSVHLGVDRFFGPKPAPPVPLLDRIVDWTVVILRFPGVLLRPLFDYDTIEAELAVNSILWAVGIYALWRFCHRRPINSVQPTAARSAASGG
jgi:hypothetical protein